MPAAAPMPALPPAPPAPSASLPALVPGLPAAPGPRDGPQASVALDWTALRRTYRWVEALHACAQDPTHHQEGDAGTHTRMVIEALLADPDAAGWRALGQSAQTVLLATALLHDVAKPATCKVEDDGRITAKGHSARGAIMARRLLWELGVPFALREQVCALIRYHQHPFWLLERAEADARQTVLRIAESARCDWLAVQAMADARGRICPDQARMLEMTQLFRLYAEDAGCLATPYPFASDHSRVEFFRKAGRDPAYAAYDDTRSRVTVTSGLPGSGKDTWITTHAGDQPIVSLDALRLELGIKPTDPQGVVIQAAKERAKGYLRKGEPFVWNATNLSRQLRGEVLDLFYAYHAHVRLVYIEVPHADLWTQNTGRTAVVPTAAIDRMAHRWEVPDRSEAHQVEYVVRDAPWPPGR